MPTSKDLKRLVRARMAKTGESYTTARQVLLNKKNPPADEYAQIAGMSDDAVVKRTGMTWAEWVEALDAVDATTMLHRDIARHVADNYDISGWWAQMVTVSYERIRGLREPGQRRAGMKAAGFDVNKSKTVAVPVGELYRAFSDADRRSEWLGAVDLTVRTSTEDKSMRVRMSDDTPVDVYFYAKGDTKSSVSIQHRKLPDKETAVRTRAFWTERLDALSELLTT